MLEFTQGLYEGIKIEETVQLVILPNQTPQEPGVILFDIEKSWDTNTKPTAGRTPR